jgi:hypothetical protein
MISKNVVEPLEDPFEAANVEASVKFPNTGASFRWNLCAWPGTGPKHPVSARPVYGTFGTVTGQLPKCSGAHATHQQATAFADRS